MYSRHLKNLNNEEIENQFVILELMLSFYKVNNDNDLYCLE